MPPSKRVFYFASGRNSSGNLAMFTAVRAAISVLRVGGFAVAELGEFVRKLVFVFDRHGIGRFVEMAIGHISGRYIELQGSRKSSAGFLHLQPE